MDSLLNGLFGSQDDSTQDRQQAQDFVQRYEQGSPWDNIDDDEAVRNYQAVASRLSPQELEASASATYEQLSPEERRQFAQWLQQQEGARADQVTDDPRQLARLTSQLQAQQPDGLAGLLGSSGLGGLLSGGGGGGALGGLLGGGQTQAGGGQNLIGKAVMGGIAAMAMKKMLGGR
jgi:hypothetical protein